MGQTLAFYGEKQLNPNLVNDALGDHLRFGPIDPQGYFASTPETITPGLIFAADTPEGVKALAPILEWSARADLGYSVVLRDGLAAPDLEADSDAVERAGNAAERVAELLREDADGGEDAALVLLCATDEIDEACAELIRMTDGMALVYNLGDALLPVDVHPYLDEGEPETPLEESEVGAAVVNLASGPVVLTPADKTLNLVVDQDRSMFEALREDLDDLAEAFTARIGAMRELVSVYEEEHEREMRELREAKPRPKPGGGVEMAPAIEAAAPTKTRREWLDPETGTWKPVGRGRPRRDVQIREVPA